VKVILKADVKGVGKAGSVVDVSDGFGRNYLVPHGLAEDATPGNLQQLEGRKNAQKKRDEKLLSGARELALKLQSKPVVVRAKAGEQGKLFGAVTNAQISDALKTELGVEVDRHKIDLGEPIKSAGDHHCSVKLAQGVTATVTVRVVGG